jgi:hypothetical protein
VTLLRGFAVWVVMMLAETLHGTARLVLLEPYVGDRRARQIAVFTGSAIVFAIALGTVRWLRATSARQLAGVGALWVGLTLAFELLLGRLVAGYSWDRIASDFDVTRGGLMPIGLLVLAISPWLAHEVRRRSRPS